MVNKGRNRTKRNSAVNNAHKCSKCGRGGHNKRTCGTINAPAVQKPVPSVKSFASSRVLRDNNANGTKRKSSTESASASQSSHVSPSRSASPDVADERVFPDGRKIVMYLDGSKKWFNRDGVLHRMDGPAVITVEGKSCWYWKGERVTPEVEGLCEEGFSDFTHPERLFDLCTNEHPLVRSVAGANLRTPAEGRLLGELMNV